MTLPTRTFCLEVSSTPAAVLIFVLSIPRSEDEVEVDVDIAWACAVCEALGIPVDILMNRVGAFALVQVLRLVVRSWGRIKIFEEFVWGEFICGNMRIEFLLICASR